MKAVIAQSDVVTAYGWGMDALWNGLMSGTTAIMPSDRFSNRRFVSNQVALIPDLPVVTGESRARAMLTRLLAPLIAKLDPDTTLMLATTVCEIEYIERAVTENRFELAHKAEPQMLLAHLKQMLGLRGDAMVLSSACASSSTALTQAASRVQRGKSKAVLVVACDVISEFVYSGFSTLLSLSDTPARPFDEHRCGLTLGEAAAWALVTSDESPLADSHSLAILGWGNTTDAVHMTAPDRNAGGLSRAIKNACGMAQVQPANIAFVAAHGTATIYNDSMELMAFRGAISTPVPIFSIKGAIGHTLGAAGLTQILTAARAMSLGIVPPTVGLSVPDSNAVGWVHSVPIQLNANRLAMSTNSGFGGVNTALLLGPVSSRSQVSSPILALPSIRAVAWFTLENCGAVGPGGFSVYQQSPPINATKEMTALIGRAIKYFARMTPDARACLAAASLAMNAARWNGDASRPVGIVGTGYNGCIAADQEYFRDFVAGGLSLGRANLFIYTLPTSALSEVAIALTLTGPTLHVQDESPSLKIVAQQAIQLVRDQEARGVLALCSDGQSAVCFAIGDGDEVEKISDLRWDESATQMARQLAARVQSS